MKRFCLILSSILASGLLTLPAHAELSFCNGVWTNQSCSGEKTIEETARKPQEPEQKKISLKKSILHEITMDRVEARRKYGVMVSGQSAEIICEDQQSSVKECEQAASKYSSRLQQSISNALKAKELEEKNEEKENTIEEKNNSTVVIIRPERRRPLSFDYQYRGQERIVSESGASINISGRSSDGRISGGLSVNNRVIRSDRPIIRAPQGKLPNKTRLRAPNLITAPEKEKPVSSIAAPIRKPKSRSAVSR